MLTLSTLIQHSSGSPSQGNRQKINKRHPNQKGRRETISMADDIILYIENPKHSTEKLLELINE